MGIKTTLPFDGYSLLFGGDDYQDDEVADKNVRRANASFDLVSAGSRQKPLSTLHWMPMTCVQEQEGSQEENVNSIDTLDATLQASGMPLTERTRRRKTRSIRVA
mmetsp:Transcript_2875/g.6775  ORF Transcript_2875/g.6775 Transcript_2875/m.6775 type:complete len:105 (-) Transcript_2875:114-428(-)